MEGAHSDSTFLTGLRGNEEPEYMKKVKDLHGQLRHAVNNLSDKVGTLLKEREKDFLAAYRHHMYNVQKELQEAKQRVREAELAMKNNDQIVKLTKERDWFRGEAIRLDDVAEGMRRDLEVMQQKVNSIDDDRSWLEKQLKNSKKQIKILRAELEANARATTTFGGGGDQFFGDESGMGRTRGMLPPAKSPAFGGAGANRSQSHMGFRSPNRRITPRDDGFDDGMSEERERRYKEQLRHLKAQLKTERRATRELRSHNVNDQSNRGELEEFFLHCVEDVKRDVARRKSKVAARNAKGRSSRSRAVDNEAPPPALRDFTATDRKSVIEKLLARDDVLSFIYDNLFPPSPEETRAQTAGPMSTGPPRSANSRRSLR